jgi:hypothetical protein
MAGAGVCVDSFPARSFEVIELPANPLRLRVVVDDRGVMLRLLPRAVVDDRRVDVRLRVCALTVVAVTPPMIADVTKTVTILIMDHPEMLKKSRSDVARSGEPHKVFHYPIIPRMP